MASFPAEINLSVNASDALRGITKVERKLGDSNNAATAFNKTLKESVDTLRKLNNVASKIRSPFELAAAQKANTLLNQQINAARERLKIRQAEVRVIEQAQRAQKALPGTALESQRRLPARTSGVPVQARAEQESARITEQQNRELFTARQRRINAEERLARALEGEVSNVVRTRTGQGPFGLLPAKTSGVPVNVRQEQLEAVAAEVSARAGNDQEIKEATDRSAFFAEREAQARRRSAERAEAIAEETNRVAQAVSNQKLLPAATQAGMSGPAGAPPLTATSRFQQKLQAEVDRQIRLTGKLNQETAERVAQYNKAQQFEDRLIKSTGRLSTERNKQAAVTKKSRLGRALVGGAFPALFGGGPAAIAGGFAGELVGDLGGVVGSALGSQIDAYVQGITKLAQSLESTSGIIQGLEEAGYRVSAATESVIASYQKAGLEAEAYELAIAEINRVLGPDGASLLSDYRIETENLSKEFEKAKAALDRELLPALTGTIRLILGLKEGFDQLATSPIFKFIQDANNLAGGVLPGFGDAGSTFNRLQELGTPSGEVVKPAEQTLAEEEAKLKILTQQTQELIKQQEKTWEANDAAREKIGIVNQQLIIEQNGANLANDKVYEARKEIIALQTQNKIKAANNALDVVALALAEKKVALAALENARNKALEAAAKAASRATASAPKSKALQLQQQEIQNQLKLFDIRARYKKLSEGDLAYYRALNVTTYDRLQQELKIIDLKEKQALAANKVAGDEALIKKRFEEERKIAEETASLEQKQNIARINALETEKQILALRNQQNETGLRTDLGRQLEDINLQMDNPFGGFEAEQIELQVEQMRRYEDAITGVDNQIAVLNKELETNSALSDEQKDKLKEQKTSLERVRSVYEEMLPAIDAAEQKQLQFQQTLQKIQPITDALANGFTDMVKSFVDGTKTAEEAFADMLTNMGNALVQEGTRMIAQYIAIGIARIFGLGMGGTGNTTYTGTSGVGQGQLLAPVSTGDNALSKLSSFLGRADGGPVSGGRPYIVGEEGQELFIPGKSGTIIPNDIFEATKAALIDNGEVVPAEEAEQTEAALAANSSNISNTYNTTTTNSAAAEEAKALERNRESINTTLAKTEIQSALEQNSKSIKNVSYKNETSVNEAFAINNSSIQSQKEAATATLERESMQQMMDTPSKLTVAYESTVINQQEYVTAEQHQKGVTQAAMKGRDMALASLKNSVRARKQVGLA